MSTRWTLYGTLGCHLCEQAEQILHQVQSARAIVWQVVDIADLNDDQQQHWARRIPVLQAGPIQLGWPFGPLDVMRLP